MHSSKTKSTKKDSFYYSALPEPIPITEQVWPEGTRPLVCTRHMTYNHENYIRECIDGVLMQKTTFPVRVCIHDDASTDKTAEIVREYQEKYPNLIWAYYQKENTFRHPNRAEMRSEFMGWAEEGKYHATCEGDDYWTNPYKLQKQVEILEKNQDCVVCHHWHKYARFKNGKWVEEDAPIVHQGYLPKHKSTVREIFNNELRVKTRTRMYRNVTKEYPLPDWFSNVPFGDVPLSFFLGKFGKFYFINESMAAYRQTDTGVSKAGLSELGERKFMVQHYKHWVNIWDYANLEYGYQYHKEATRTVNQFYKIIIGNMRFTPVELYDLLRFHFIQRKIATLKKWPNTIWIILYCFKTMMYKTVQKMKLV